MKECQNYWETIEKNWLSQNFDFLSLKGLSLGHFLETCNSCRYHWILIFLVVTYKLEVWEQICAWIFYCFNFERNYDVLKSKTSSILLTKIQTLIKTKLNQIKKIPHIILERRNLFFNSYGARERKRGHFFTVYFDRRDFFKFLFYLNV